jgi:uncharacterized protein (TIGR03083 family)
MQTELEPVHTEHLFRGLARRLGALLDALPPESWGAKTSYPHWTVHDIATHMLQTGLCRLSAQRDGYRPGATAAPEPTSAPDDYEGVSEMIDAANDRWQNTLSVLSPRVIVDLLKSTEKRLARYLSRTDRGAWAPVGVLWAGEPRSRRWFDTSREFTERWHHQQQIREAVGARSITEPKYLGPVIRTLIRAVPAWYGPIRPEGDVSVRIEITGRSGGVFTLCSDRDSWHLRGGRVDPFGPGTTQRAGLITVAQRRG